MCIAYCSFAYYTQGAFSFVLSSLCGVLSFSLCCQVRKHLSSSHHFHVKSTAAVLCVYIITSMIFARDECLLLSHKVNHRQVCNWCFEVRFFLFFVLFGLFCLIV